MPWLKSSLAVAGMLGFYFATLSLLGGGFAFAWSQFTKYWYLILPITFTFALNVSTMTGTTSAVFMAACCAHHVAELLPFLGLFSAASFLVRYQVPAMILALSLNLFFLLKSKLFHLRGGTITSIQHL